MWLGRQLQTARFSLEVQEVFSPHGLGRQGSPRSREGAGWARGRLGTTGRGRGLLTGRGAAAGRGRLTPTWAPLRRSFRVFTIGRSYVGEMCKKN